jgi:hypothetical protein
MATFIDMLELVWMRDGQISRLATEDDTQVYLMRCYGGSDCDADRS